MTSNSIQLNLPTRKVLLIGIGTTATLILLVVLQDIMQALVSGYSYYLSESLLFNSVWFFYLPIGLLLMRLMTRVSGASENRLSIILLVALAIGVHTLVFPFVVWIVSTLFYNHTYAYGQALIYTISNNIYQYVLAYGTLGYVGHLQLNQNNEKLPAHASHFLKMITITTGTKNIVISTEQVLYVKACSPYIAFHTNTGKYLQLQTLKSVQADLDPDHFIRIHKSTLINVKVVQSFKSRLNGDYDVMLNNGESVRLSRGYSKEFKEKLISRSTLCPNNYSG